MTERLIRHIWQRADRAYCGAAWTVSRTLVEELVCPACAELLRAERAASQQSGSHPPLR